jgi:hypothetical protein
MDGVCGDIENTIRHVFDTYIKTDDFHIKKIHFIVYVSLQEE